MSDTNKPDLKERVDTALDILPYKPSTIKTLNPELVDSFLSTDVKEYKKDPTEDETSEMALEDYKNARDKLTQLISVGESAIESFKDIAEETQEPRAFEVLANLIKTTADMTKTLMDNAKTKTNIDKERLGMKHSSQSSKSSNESSSVTNTQTNNNIFVGTTKDLLALLDESKEK